MNLVSRELNKLLDEFEVQDDQREELHQLLKREYKSRFITTFLIVLTITVIIFITLSYILFY